MFENVLVGATFGSATRLLRQLRTTPRSKRSSTTGLLDKANVVGGDAHPAHRKRLELARALATKPSVLLLDEIAGGLTEAEVLELVATSADPRATGVAIVWIEHIVHALLSVVDRMMAVDDGRKLDRGRPSRGDGLRRGAGRLPRRRVRRR